MTRVPLREVCRQDRKTVRPGHRADLRYIGMESIEAGTGLLAQGELSKTPDDPQANSFAFGPDHVLYGKLRPYLNKVLVPSFEGKCSTEIIPLLPSEVLDRRYLAYFLRNTATVSRISSKVAGARMPRADMEFVLGLDLPLPSLAEQRRIVDLLSRAEGIVRLRREAQQKAQAVIPALFLDMFGDPATNPKGWPTFEIGKLADIAYGLADKLDTSITAENGDRILTISNVLLDGTIDDNVHRYCQPTSKQRQRALLCRGDLLFNWRNGSPEHVGKTARWTGDEPVLHVSFLLRLRPNQTLASSAYLWALLNRLRASGFFVRQSRQQVNRKFNASELAGLRIPVPPTPQQAIFEKLLAAHRRMITLHSDAEKTSNATFNALLARAFGIDKSVSVQSPVREIA